MRKSDFDKMVDKYVQGKGIRFTDENFGSHHVGFKYYFLYTLNGNIHNAFYTKKEVVDYIRHGSNDCFF